MKLIDILVEESIENGWSWPERANCITQDSDREIMPATCQPCVAKFEASFNRWFLNGSRIGGFIADILASDYETAIITREQYEAALSAKNEGWIYWGGGECPVDTKTLVDIRLKVGFTYKSCHPGDYSWRHAGGGGDIIAYRLHKQKEATQADDEADLNDCIGQGVATAWGGDGLPPVGCECEYSLNAGKTWWKCKIDYIVGTQGVVMLCDTFEGVQYVQFSSYGSALKFRPIRSEADKKREECIAKLTDAICGEIPDTGMATAAMFATRAYDAIAAGKVRGVKLED